jgi:hypothetical protein
MESSFTSYPEIKIAAPRQAASVRSEGTLYRIWRAAVGRDLT